MNIVVQVVLYLVSGVAGGFLGGFMVAFRIGSWRQQVDDRLEAHECRLRDGTDRVRNVPVLSAKIDALIETVGELKLLVRTVANESVTHRECDRRHGCDKPARD